MDGPSPLAPAPQRRRVRVFAAPGGRPRSPWRRWGVIAAGWFFILLGVVGAVLPVLQGWLFFAIGLLLLSREIAWAERLRLRLFRRFPKLGECSEAAEAWVSRQGERFLGWFRRS
jgi:Putative transmembrane protein (PGPGW)